MRKVSPGDIRLNCVDFIAYDSYSAYWKYNHPYRNPILLQGHPVKSNVFFVADVIPIWKNGELAREVVKFYVNGDITKMYYSIMGYFVNHTRKIKD
jgi:hypothetical protein